MESYKWPLRESNCINHECREKRNPRMNYSCLYAAHEKRNALANLFIYLLIFACYTMLYHI